MSRTALIGLPARYGAAAEALVRRHLGVRRFAVIPVLIVALAVLTAGACRSRPPSDDDFYAQMLPFDSASVRLATARDTIALTLQLARSAEEQRLGLMERLQLGERSGMLFIYRRAQPPDAGFWMYRTRIPLDIAFLDSAGVVRAIRTMEPCPEGDSDRCPDYVPGVPYRYALEMNAGFFERLGIGVATGRLLVEELPIER